RSMPALIYMSSPGFPPRLLRHFPPPFASANGGRWRAARQRCETEGALVRCRRPPPSAREERALPPPSMLRFAPHGGGKSADAPNTFLPHSRSEWREVASSAPALRDGGGVGPLLKAPSVTPRAA